MSTFDNIDPVEDFKGYQKAVFKSLVSATAAINAIPVNVIGFYRSLDKQFAKILDQTASVSLINANTLLQRCAADTGVECKDFEEVDEIKKDDEPLFTNRKEKRNEENTNKEGAPRRRDVGGRWHSAGANGSAFSLCCSLLYCYDFWK